MEKNIQIFLVLFFIAWAFRMVYRFNALYDCIFMLLISIAIYNNGKTD